MRGIVLGCALWIALIASGCESKSKLIEVEGSVTLDGKALEEGDIVFVPHDKTQGPEGGKIKDGKYKLKAKAGKNKVEIRASREVPGKKGPMGEPLVEQFIPPAYNDKSTLEADVSKGKTFDFPLKSKP